MKFMPTAALPQAGQMRESTGTAVGKFFMVGSIFPESLRRDVDSP